jgi:nitroreductase
MDKEQFFRLLKQRRSIRAFDKRRLDDSVLDVILEACDLAPSSGVLQTFEIYKVESLEKKNRLVAAARDQTFVADAPLLLVFCASPSRSVHKYGERLQLFSVQDATIAAAYAQLAVYALGLTTVWTGRLTKEKCQRYWAYRRGTGQSRCCQ